MPGKRALRGTEPLGFVPPLIEHCPLCGRVLPRDATVDEHHLVPKSQGGREAFRIHRICHRKIHATFTEAQLARDFNTWQALRAHEAIQSFIKWVAGKDPSYYDNSRAAKSRA
jgi:hypothetical protein